MDPDWIEHHRATDGELLGWILPQGEDFVPIDRLGRRVGPAGDWFSAEHRLDDLGLAYLAEPYELRVEDGSWIRVRLTEVSVSGIRVKEEDWGAIDVPQSDHLLPFPMPVFLRELGGARC